LARRVLRAVALAASVAAALGCRDGAAIAQGSPACGTDLRLLVVSANGGERDLAAIRAALGYVGTPCDLYVATQTPGGMTAARLATGCHANYNGVILTTDALLYSTAGGTQVSALTSPEFHALADFRA